MKIKNWDKWQTYRSDRNTPPWIKVHRNLFSNPEWFELTDTEKGQLVSIWILAADKSGEIPDNSTIIQRMCGLQNKPNINKFIELGFIDGTLTSDGCQGDATVTHQTRLDKTRPEEIRLERDKKKRFAPPSILEVNEHIKKSSYQVNGERFINFYESNGWKVGKNPMKSWKAALANWNSRDKKGNGKSQSKTDDFNKWLDEEDDFIEGECNVVN